MAQLRRHGETIRSLKTDIVVISFGTSLGARAWLRETDAPFQLLLDPKRAAYQAYGLEHSLRHSWNLKTVWRYLQLFRQGYRWRGIQGDSGQLGGDFIVDTQGLIRLAYHSHDPTDRPAIEQLLAVLRGLIHSGENG